MRKLPDTSVPARVDLAPWRQTRGSEPSYILESFQYDVPSVVLTLVHHPNLSRLSRHETPDLSHKCHEGHLLAVRGFARPIGSCHDHLQGEFVPYGSLIVRNGLLTMGQRSCWPPAMCVSLGMYVSTQSS
jgi:hypothetical protein